MSLTVRKIEEAGDGAMAPRLIHELMKSLPEEGRRMPLAQRLAWLTAAAALLDVLYGGEAVVHVRVEDGDTVVLN